MAPKPNTLARLAIPVMLALGGIGVAIAVGINTTRPNPQAAPNAGPTGQDAQANADDPASAERGGGERSVDGPDVAAEQDQPVAGEGLGALRARVFAGAVQQMLDAPAIGDLGFSTDYRMRVAFSPIGAGVRELRLAHELDSVTNDRLARSGQAVADAHYVLLQSPRVRTVQNAATGATLTETLVPLAAFSVQIGAQTVYFPGPPNATDGYWRPTGPAGEFEAIIEDVSGAAVVRLVRRYEVAPNSNDLHVSQRVENLTDSALSVRLVQLGPADMPEDSLGYGGDKRRLRFGYLSDPAIDPQRTVVAASDYLIPRRTALGQMDKATGAYPEVATAWPNQASDEHNRELVWVGLTNRYFGVVAHKLGDPDVLARDKPFASVEKVQRLVLNRPAPKSGLFGQSWENTADMALSLSSAPVRVGAGEAHEFGVGLYVGPLSKPSIRESRIASVLGIDGIVVYNFGGFCAACTFTWLTKPLLELLRFLHSLTHDWSIAVILLVIIVRSCLHPVTRWSQIRVQRFGKQMQAMAPKQKIIQEKFKDDPQRMREEMSKLWKEEGISPAGFLGCLPMFLQSPVWIALYATLYFAIELRHEPAFFGVFQTISGGKWHFLSDLSEPDRFIYFGKVVATLPLMGSVSSLNLLPILLGFVFFAHQKYLTPPTAATMTPEQQTQQKMMKVMTVVMFPLFMYNAPSAMALYFITNSSIAIVENRWIRKHIETHGLLDLDKIKSKKRKGPKPGGFLDRLQQAAAEQQRRREEGTRTSARNQPRMGRTDSGVTRKYKKKR